MLTINGIEKLEGRNVGALNAVWKITKVNINDAGDYYGIVCREQPDTTGNYVVLYLMREKEDGEYLIGSNKSTISNAVSINNMKNRYEFLRLIQKEIERALC